MYAYMCQVGLSANFRKMHGFLEQNVTKVCQNLVFMILKSHNNVKAVES